MRKTDEQILIATEEAALKEKAATLNLLHRLAEVSARKLYAKSGFGSLFDFCVRRLKMSEAQAARRVNATRLLMEIPEVEEKVQSGELTLTALSQAQSHFRRNKLTKQEKKDILAKIESKSSREIEKMLVKPGEINERIWPVSENITGIKFGAPNDLMADLERLIELWGDMAMVDLVKKMAKICLAEDPLTKSNKTRVRPAPKSRNRHIPNAVRSIVWKRDKGTCTTPGCHSRYRLQLDHILPYAQGGPHTGHNLRLRCPVHNLAY